MNRPAFQFYVGDWQSDSKLKRAGFYLKGVWIDLLCLFHDNAEYGLLRWSLDEISNAIGCKKKDLLDLLRLGILKGSEKDGEKVSFSITISKKNAPSLEVFVLENEPNPLFFSSRMLRDEYIRNNRGKHGSESQKNPAVPRPSGLEKDTLSISEKDTLSTEEKDTFPPSPSSSSSFSSSNANETTKENTKEKEPLLSPTSESEKKQKRNKRTELQSWPKDFHLDDHLRQYAQSKGIRNVGKVWEEFENWHRAKGSKFVDWSRAWYTWVGKKIEFDGGSSKAIDYALFEKERITDPNEPVDKDGYPRPTEQCPVSSGWVLHDLEKTWGYRMEPLPGQVKGTWIDEPRRRKQVAI